MVLRLSVIIFLLSQPCNCNHCPSPDCDVLLQRLYILQFNSIQFYSGTRSDINIEINTK